MPKAFKITQGKGFHLTFDNGYTLSTQMGPGNYCGNYRMPLMKSMNDIDSLPDSDTVETAVLDSEGSFVLFSWSEEYQCWEKGGEDVQGYVTLSQWLKLVEAVRSL